MSYRIAVDAGIASGNHNLGHVAFGTFNALFPKGAYFGSANFIGPYNVQVIRPSLRITSPSKRIVIWPNIEMLWRQSRQDGIYSIPAVLIQSGSPKDSLYIGLQADLNIQWQQNRHLTWSVDGEHFFAATFLHQTTDGKSNNFFAPGVSYRF
jgi:Alginate export